MKIEDVGAVITGGGSGLGAAVAHLLSARGARVAIIDRDRAAAEKVAALLQSPYFAIDICSETDVATALSTAAERLQRFNVLVNCAGVGTGGRVLGPKGPLPLEDFRRTIDVNLVGTFNCIRLAASQFSRSPRRGDGEQGVIINTASAAAFEGQVGQAAYSASKAGIVGMTLPLARDLADWGIRLVTIAPGLFDTPMTGGLPPFVRESLTRQLVYPRRMGQPQEFAELVLHSITNSMLNGTTLRLDGAVRMGAR